MPERLRGRRKPCGIFPTCIAASAIAVAGWRKRVSITCATDPRQPPGRRSGDPGRPGRAARIRRFRRAGETLPARTAAARRQPVYAADRPGGSRHGRTALPAANSSAADRFLSVNPGMRRREKQPDHPDPTTALSSRATCWRGFRTSIRNSRNLRRCCRRGPRPAVGLKASPRLRKVVDRRPDRRGSPVKPHAAVELLITPASTWLFVRPGCLAGVLRTPLPTSVQPIMPLLANSRCPYNCMRSPRVAGSGGLLYGIDGQHHRRRAAPAGVEATSGSPPAAAVCRGSCPPRQRDLHALVGMPSD